MLDTFSGKIKEPVRINRGPYQQCSDKWGCSVSWNIWINCSVLLIGYLQSFEDKMKIAPVGICEYYHVHQNIKW